MRLELGLDLPERRIGLSAHDFAQALGAPEVILTRAAKLGGAPTVASRFVQRLAAVAGETRWKAALARGEHYLALGARRSITPAQGRKPRRAPGPKPPLEARPTAAVGHRDRASGCAIPTRSTPSMFCGCGRSTPSTRRPARATAAPSSTTRSANSPRPSRQAAGRPVGELLALGETAFRAARGFSRGARVLVAALPAHRALVRWRGNASGAPMLDSDACRNSRRASTIPLGNARRSRSPRAPTASSSCNDGTLRHPRLQDRPAADRAAGAYGLVAATHARRRDPARAAASRTIPAGGSVAEFAYVRLRGGDPAGRAEADRVQGRHTRRTVKPTWRCASSPAWSRDFADRDEPYRLAGRTRCGRRTTATTTISRA